MNIYFVCTGNTCRSPMAESLLRSKQIEGVQVRSAGVFAVDGMPISEHSRQLLADSNIHVPSTSKLLTEEEVIWADLILTMTAAHRDTVRGKFSSHANKVFTLKEYVGDPSRDVQDPYGGTFELYKQTFDELSEQINVLARKLQEEKK